MLLDRIIDLSLPERRASILAHAEGALRTKKPDAAAVTRALVALTAKLGVEGPRHTARTVRWTSAMARALGVRVSRAGAWLHDIGKLAVPDGVIHKPGLYDERDWTLLRAHSEVGARMLEGVPGLEEAAELVLTHHEYFDGSGYPRGLRGADIPIAARIFAVADSYDAMTRTGKEREWGEPLTRERALADLGRRYDPECVECFERVLRNEGRRLPKTTNL